MARVLNKILESYFCKRTFNQLKILQICNIHCFCSITEPVLSCFVKIHSVTFLKLAAMSLQQAWRTNLNWLKNQNLKQKKNLKFLELL